MALLQFLRAGVLAYHGPALLTDLAENGGILPIVAEGVRRAVVNEPHPFELSPAPEWTEFHQPWEDDPQATRRPLQPGDGWVWLQGGCAAQGHLIGGCAEVPDMLCGSPSWPEAALWRGAVLVLETSEDVPSPQQVGYWLCKYAAQNLLAKQSLLDTRWAQDFPVGSAA